MCRHRSSIHCHGEIRMSWPWCGSGSVLYLNYYHFSSIQASGITKTIATEPLSSNSAYVVVVPSLLFQPPTPRTRPRPQLKSALRNGISSGRFPASRGTSAKPPTKAGFLRPPLPPKPDHQWRWGPLLPGTGFFLGLATSTFREFLRHHTTPSIPFLSPPPPGTSLTIITSHLYRPPRRPRP